MEFYGDHLPRKIFLFAPILTLKPVHHSGLSVIHYCTGLSPLFDFCLFPSFVYVPLEEHAGSWWVSLLVSWESLLPQLLCMSILVPTASYCASACVATSLCSETTRKWSHSRRMLNSPGENAHLWEWGPMRAPQGIEWNPGWTAGRPQE